MRVRVTKRVESDSFLYFPEPRRLAHAGEEHPAGMNPHGAVWLELPEGHLGVKPDEYELVECTLEELARAPEVVRLRYRVRELEQATSDLAETRLALVALLRVLSTIEVLGEWEATDTNPRMRKEKRAVVDAIVERAWEVSKDEWYLKHKAWLERRRSAESAP